MTHILAVGARSIPPSGPTTALLFPGESAPDPRPGLTVHPVQDLQSALFTIRQLYADPRSIASLGAVEVVGTDEISRAAIESRLAEFIEDLGNCAIDSWDGALNAFRNGARLANGWTSAGLIDALAGKPAICLGAGPSATPEALAEIAELSRSHYVFASDSMLGACKAAGFTPHFATMIERPLAMHQVVAGLGKGTTLIAPPVIDPACASEFERVLWWWAGDALYAWLGPDLPAVSPGRSAGTLSVAAAILAGCSPIYLVGHDLAYAPGRVGHCSSAHALAVDTQKEEDAKPDGGRYGSRKFEVPGYSGHPVWTCGLWNLFRGDIESTVANNPRYKVYSAGKYRGAAIAGVEVRDLPTGALHWRLPAMPDIPRSWLPDPRDRLESFAKDVIAMHRRAALAVQFLEGAAKPDYKEIAEHLAVRSWCSTGNSALFDYLLRPLNYSLALRLTMRPETQPGCIGILARTLVALAHRISEDIWRIQWKA